MCLPEEYISQYIKKDNSQKGEASSRNDGSEIALIINTIIDILTRRKKWLELFIFSFNNKDHF